MATATPRPQRRPSPRRAPRLRVVRSEQRARAVGTLGTLVAGFFFVTLFALAGLHAVVVQTQARLDAVNNEIAALEAERIDALAELAWFESPAGLAEAATAAGLVEARVAMLPPVAPGRLAPPGEADPFGPLGAEAASTPGGAAG